MTDDELISNLPAGYRFTFLCIGLAKRALATPGISTNEQLKLLQEINDCVDMFVSREMVAAIEPMSDVEYRMYSEAASLDQGDQKLSPSFSVLTSGQTFRAFCKVNPSYVAALRCGALKSQNAPNSPSAEKNDPIGSSPVHKDKRA